LLYYEQSHKLKTILKIFEVIQEIYIAHKIYTVNNMKN